MERVEPRKNPRQERSRALVARILDATAHLLVRGGPARLTTNAVAEAACVSVGSVYQYFPSKEALVSALHARHAEEMIALVREGVRDRSAGKARPPLDVRLRSLVAAVVHAHFTAPALHLALEVALARFDGEPGPAALDDPAHLLEALVREHDDEIDVACPTTVARVLAVAVHALIHDALARAPTSVETERALVDECVTLALRYLAPSRAPSRSRKGATSQ